MALSESKLATELQNVTPTMDPASAALALATAYGDYMRDAITGPPPPSDIPINSPAVTLVAIPAMAAAMTFSGDATPTQGATILVGGLIAFWAAMVAAPPAFFSGATLITPPPFPIISAIAAVFVDNTANKKSLEESTEALAAVIHPATDTIGTATFGVPVYPIT